MDKFLQNVGAAYNLSVVSLVIVSLRARRAADGSQEASPDDLAWVGSSGMLGAVTGQLTFGLLGDVLGRQQALFLTTLLLVIGAILSATLPQPGPELYSTLSWCRLVTGIGIGGIYPLTAVSSMEEDESSSTSRYAISNTRRTLLVFSGQGWGQLLAPVLVYVIATDANEYEEETWRIALGLGAVPGFVSLLFMLRSWWKHRRHSRVQMEDVILATAGQHPDNIAAVESQTRILQTEKKPMWRMLYDLDNLKRLVGTGGSWFVFDVAFYANVVFAPTILEMVFNLGPSAGAKAMAGPTCLVFLIALPGYYAAVLLVDRLGLKRLQMGTFIIIGALYLAMGFSASVAPPPVLFAMYAISFTLFNMGPNATTFCLPAKTFPYQARSTFNGVSAALGKLGAAYGTSMFPYVINQSGDAAGLFFTAGVCLFGALLTKFAVEGDFPTDLVGAGEASSVLLERDAPRTLVEMAPIAFHRVGGNGGDADVDGAIKPSSMAFAMKQTKVVDRTVAGGDVNPFLEHAQAPTNKTEFELDNI